MAALTPTDTAKRAHRTIATALVFGVLWAVYLARQLQLRGIAQYLPYLMVGVILLLAVVGPASYLKTIPAIATVNLLGGVALAALIWWLWLAMQPAPAGANKAPPASLASLALATLLVQLALGAWVSANFAGTACTGVWECEQHADDNSAWSGLWYLRELSVDGGGRIVVEQAQVLIHRAHRVGALVTTLVLTVFGISALRRKDALAFWGRILLGLLALQLALGFASLELGLPLLVVLSHNLVASLLVLCLLRMTLLTRLPIAASATEASS